MASKTLILRPIAITCGDESLVSFYPTDATIANAHLLVDEETADDDSTYITLSPGAAVKYYFEYNKPYNCTAITDVSFRFRSCPEVKGSNNMSNQISHKVEILDYDDSISMYGHSFATSDVMYYDYDATETNKGNIATYLSGVSNANINISQTVGTGDKNNPIRTTQVYMQITYDYENGLYLKENGEWQTVDGIVYHKQSGTWIETDTTVFTAGKYKLQIL